VPRPDEQEHHHLKKCQLELLNKLYHLQYRRSLDSWFVDGGFLSKPLAEAQDVFKAAIEGKDEIMRQHSGELVRELYLNNVQSDVESLIEPTVNNGVQVNRKDCQQRRIDVLFQVKQTRVCIKKV
jgi:hypothetical protein